MTNVVSINDKRVNNFVQDQADIFAKALMSMSRMQWAKNMSGDEALRMAAMSFQKAAEKMK